MMKDMAQIKKLEDLHFQRGTPDSGLGSNHMPGMGNSAYNTIGYPSAQRNITAHIQSLISNLDHLHLGRSPRGWTTSVVAAPSTPICVVFNTTSTTSIWDDHHALGPPQSSPLPPRQSASSSTFSALSLCPQH
uniref:Uncharacterized protein n=1 Tax=Fagus sylvatica TaxID=28930 RepID=A0A2N9G4Y7_FAGSY